MSDNLETVKSWIKNVVKRARYQEREIPLSASLEWKKDKELIQHISGKFFSICCLKWNFKESAVLSQAFIDQREVGLLGFIYHNRSKKPSLLVQAKLEPGNDNLVQLAPTYQATQSNSMRVHGGLLPFYYSQFFEDETMDVISVSVQSEQGSRFFHKLNKNTVIRSDTKLKEASYLFRWLEVDLFLKLLGESNLVNTDSRSVIATSHWKHLIHREPFMRSTGSLGSMMNKSYYKIIGLHSLAHIKKQLRAKRTNDLVVRRCALTRLKNKESSVVFRQIKTLGREVSHWDQPFIASDIESECELYIATINGVVHALFRFQAEVGLANKVEFGPSYLSGGSTGVVGGKLVGKVMRSILQSDEGGRFYHVRTNYRLVDVGEVFKFEKTDVWMTLGQVQFLMLESGYFTNEARSAVSLLLSFL